MPNSPTPDFPEVLENPYLSPEEQDMELEPVKIGPGAYASPDPATSEHAMVTSWGDEPLETHVAAAAAEKAAEAREGDYNSMSKADLEKLAKERELEVEGTGANKSVKKSDLVGALQRDDTEEMDSRDFLAEVDEAQDEEALKAAEEKYLASDKKYSRVDKAIERKREELANSSNSE